MTADDEEVERRLTESKASLFAVPVTIPTMQQLARRRAMRSARRIRIVLSVGTVLVLAGIWKLASASDQTHTLRVTAGTTNPIVVVEAPTSLEPPEVRSTSTFPPTTEPPLNSVAPAIGIPPPPDISADLQVPLCRDLAPLVDGLVGGPLVPVGARTRQSPGQPDVACEILYAIPGKTAEVVIGRIFPELGAFPADCLPCKPTGDSDEITLYWATGSTVFIDPTGADYAHAVQYVSVIVNRVDGTTLYVSTYGRPDANTATEIARAFDERLG